MFYEAEIKPLEPDLDNASAGKRSKNLKNRANRSSALERFFIFKIEKEQLNESSNAQYWQSIC